MSRSRFAPTTALPARQSAAKAHSPAPGPIARHGLLLILRRSLPRSRVKPQTCFQSLFAPRLVESGANTYSHLSGHSHPVSIAGIHPYIGSLR